MSTEEITKPEATITPETPTVTPPAPAKPEEVPEPAKEPTEPPEDADTFPREYVEKLRTESAANRTKATGMAEELHSLRVASLGLLADPTDLPHTEGMDTLEAVKQAAEDLVARKPHLKIRKVAGNIGQHEQQTPPASAGLLGRMRKNT